ncbi:hypothetical protein A8F94_08150 [Bacillus sp. FJAT-27225]|uniref:YkvA family protein n=1 Tax=Bacillus sp. FJAT-27225 TaxID=1743144 RepID=UPI00080C2149|nr:DUF1232 domain-containing protein [Bacillus sp. FJAT-27225]OCA87805.1 hypothetical protein A8F94_08150 [Bacillus sp. FJAT-27225]
MIKEDFYQDLRMKIRDWIGSENGKTKKFAEYVLFAPDLFHLLCKLSLDENVSVMHKAKLAGAIAYFVSPIDVIPEAITGPVGYVDDIAIAAYVLNNIINDTNPDLVKSHWAGDEDVLNVIQRILEIADGMLGSGVWNTLKRKFS